MNLNCFLRRATARTEREPQVRVTQNWIRGKKKKQESAVSYIFGITVLITRKKKKKTPTLKWYHAELEEEGPEGSKS